MKIWVLHMDELKIIEPLILTLRGQRVILDTDLAELYGVQTKRLNEQVKRNAERFPEDFMFRLTEEEKSEVVANCDHLQKLKFSPQLPAVYTEHGAIMVAMVLNSPEATTMSVFVVRGFVQMRERLAANAEIIKRLAEIDKTLLEHDQALSVIWKNLQPLLTPPSDPPKRKIGFDYKDEGNRL